MEHMYKNSPLENKKISNLDIPETKFKENETIHGTLYQKQEKQKWKIKEINKNNTEEILKIKKPTHTTLSFSANIQTTKNGEKILKNTQIKQSIQPISNKEYYYTKLTNLPSKIKKITTNLKTLLHL